MMIRPGKLKYPSLLYPAAMLLFIAVCSAMLNYFTPLTGDDLNKWFAAGGALDSYPNEQTRKFIAGSYFQNNGRLLDIFGVVLLARAPRLLIASLLGLGSAFYFFSILFAVLFLREQHGAVAARRQPNPVHHPFACSLLLTATLLITPWWDSLWLRCCQLSYIIGTAFTLLFITLFFTAGKRHSGFGKTVLLAIIAFCASSAHEQNAIALCCAFMMVILFNRKKEKLTFNQRVMSIAMGLGAIVSVCAPSTLRKLNEFTLPQVGPRDILLTTVPLMALLTVSIVIPLLFRKSRKYILAEIPTATGVFFLTGLVSALIAMKIGTPGRTGVLAEACALIVIARFIPVVHLHINNISAIILTSLATAFICCHYIVAIIYQREACEEIEDAIGQYRANYDGVVFADITRREAMPDILLNRVKSLADNDDRHLCYVYSHVYRADTVPFVVLPTPFKEHLPLINESLTINGITISRKRPADVVMTHTLDGYPLEILPGTPPLLLTPLPSSPLVPTPSSLSTSSSLVPRPSSLYIIEPLHLDPGDALRHY